MFSKIKSESDNATDNFVRPCVVRMYVSQHLINFPSYPASTAECIKRVPTNFLLPLIEPSAREVFISWNLIEREERGGTSEENMAQADRDSKQRQR